MDLFFGGVQVVFIGDFLSIGTGRSHPSISHLISRPVSTPDFENVCFIADLGIVEDMIQRGFIPVDLGLPGREYGPEHDYALHHVYDGDLDQGFIDFYLGTRNAPMNYQDFHDRRYMAT